MKKYKKINPMIILMRGKPATGKSFIARFLSSELGIPFIDKDDIKDIVADYFTEQSVADQFSHAIMFNIASSYLKNNTSIICDSPLYPPYVYLKAQELSDSFKAPIKIIHVIVGDVEEWEKRLNSRNNQDLPFHRYRGWEAHKDKLLIDNFEPIEGELIIDSGNFEKQRDVIIEYLTNDNKKL